MGVVDGMASPSLAGWTRYQPQGGNCGQPLGKYDVTGSTIVQEHVRGGCLQAPCRPRFRSRSRRNPRRSVRDGACEHVIVIGSVPSAGYHSLISKGTRSPNEARL